MTTPNHHINQQWGDHNVNIIKVFEEVKTEINECGQTDQVHDFKFGAVKKQTLIVLADLLQEKAKKILLLASGIALMNNHDAITEPDLRRAIDCIDEKLDAILLENQDD